MIRRSGAVASLVLLAGFLSTRGAGAVEMEMFTREGCPWCAEAERFVATLAHERPDLRVTRYDVERDPAARARLVSLAGDAGIGRPGVPAFRLRGELLVGFRPGDTDARIRALLAARTRAPCGSCSSCSRCW
jgi:glutaredoxin